MTDDAALLKRYARNRSQSAFEELLRRYSGLVYSAALRRSNGDTHRAEDVVQQVFCSLARHAEKLSSHPALSAWLYTATRNAAASMWISEQRRRMRENESAADRCDAENADSTAWADVRSVLDEAMDSLGVTDRTAVLMRFFEQRSYADIGTALRMTENAARVRTARALDKLRLCLAKRGVKSTAAALGAVITQQAVSAAPREIISGVMLRVGTSQAAAPSLSLGVLKLPVSVAALLAGVATSCIVIWAILFAMSHTGGGAALPIANESSLSARASRPKSTAPDAEAPVGNTNASATSGERATAAQLLQRILEAYAGLSSYQDVGNAHRTWEKTRTTDVIEFRTIYRRPDCLRLDWSSLPIIRGTNHPEYSLACKAGAVSLLNRTRIEQKANTTPLVALATRSTSTAGASHHVPILLLADRTAHWFTLGKLERLELAPAEIVDGVPCHAVKGFHPNGSRYTVWAGKDDYLVRKIEVVGRLSVILPRRGQPSTPTSDVYVETHRSIVTNAVVPDIAFDFSQLLTQPKGSQQSISN